MSSHTNINNVRRYKAHVSIFGTNQLHLRNPYIVAWWSAAFSGFGYILLGKNLRGYIFIIWEIFININAKVNLAMIYTFQGNIELAKDVINTRWIMMYIPVYLFGIWDSYRSAVELNKVYLLAERENHSYQTFKLNALEINYLEKRNPIMAAIWSLFAPGLGHLYIHRTLTSFILIICLTVFFYFSHALEAITLLLNGKITESTAILNEEWLLFLPSLFCFSIYDSYVHTVENNKLFDKEQRKYLKENYMHRNFRILKGKKVK